MELHKTGTYEVGASLEAQKAQSLKYTLGFPKKILKNLVLGKRFTLTENIEKKFGETFRKSRTLSTNLTIGRLFSPIWKIA